jgi:hypothetical protein
MKKINEPTAEGFQLGYTLAKWVDAEEAKVPLANDRARCHNCAFRQGSYPNGSPQTTMDALKCAMEGLPFLCHEDMLPCAGWALLRRCAPASKTKAFWPFSDEPETAASPEPKGGAASGGTK